MNFSSGPRRYRCALCRVPVEVVHDKVQLEGHTVHKECFRCGICDTALIPGSCSFDHELYRHFGPMWFCPAHMYLGSGEKYELLVAKYGPPRVVRV